MKYKILILLVSVFFLLYNCENKNKVSLNLNSDSLNIGHTYWWQNSGPFIGLCGDEYSLVFLGVVKEINKPIKDNSSNYISQKGNIEIIEVLKKKKLTKENYKNQKYFLSNCFYNSNFKKGDKVMVFCYEYEGRYAIPSFKSIIKIDKFDDQIVKSAKQYIKTNQNPITIKKDLELWALKGFGEDLKKIIKCKEEMNKQK